MLREKLMECHVSSREIFRELFPLLTESRPYGWYELDTDVFADEIKVSKSAVYHALEDLRRHGIIRKGTWSIYCPLLVAEMVVRVTR